MVSGLKINDTLVVIIYSTRHMSPFHSDLYLLVLAKRGHNVGILLPLVDAWPSHGLPYGISKFLSQTVPAFWNGAMRPTNYVVQFFFLILNLMLP